MFITNFRKTIRPAYTLTKKDVCRVCVDIMIPAVFEKLNQILTFAPVLAFPVSFLLEIDASLPDMGEIL